MDTATRSLIASAPLVLTSFDGTLVDLTTDWPGVTDRLRRQAFAAGWGWRTDASLDENLWRIRNEFGDGAHGLLCGLLAVAEADGFRSDRLNGPLLDQLYDRGAAPTAIVANNSRRAISQILRRSEFGGILVAVYGREDVWVSKPDPSGILAACGDFGLDPSEAIYIGDSAADEEAAERAGISNFIWSRPTLVYQRAA